MPDERLIALKI